MKGYIKLRKKALDLLKSKLSKDLYYHGVHHTLDVLDVINKYIRYYKIDPYNAKILRIAVLLHDIGFVVSNKDHEASSVAIAKEMMSDLGFSKEEIEKVKALILATRVPQRPKNKLERIICDADLDYLGRKDFYKISDLLFKELKMYTALNTKKAWNKAQIKFLEAHKYHTDFAKKNRAPLKEKRIKELKQLLKS